VKEWTKQESTINFIEQINALRARELPVGNWVYKMKFDGYRTLVFKADQEITSSHAERF
jgi:ATP-dependent DNA ligase